MVYLNENPHFHPATPADTPRSSSSGTIDRSQPQDVRASYQSNAGPDRIGLARETRFQPYGTHRAYPVEHVGEEAGPSTLVLHPINFVDPPTTPVIPPIQSPDPPSTLVLPPIRFIGSPTTLVLPPIRSLGLPTMEPSGGIPETSADAETDPSSAEEDEAPVSHFYHSHILHAPNGSFGVRNQAPPGHLVTGPSLKFAVISASGDKKIHAN